MTTTRLSLQLAAELPEDTSDAWTDDQYPEDDDTRPSLSTGRLFDVTTYPL